MRWSRSRCEIAREFSSGWPRSSSPLARAAALRPPRPAPAARSTSAAIRGGIDGDQQVALLDQRAFAEMHRLHGAGDPRADVDALDRLEPAGELVPRHRLARSTTATETGIGRHRCDRAGLCGSGTVDHEQAAPPRRLPRLHSSAAAKDRVFTVLHGTPVQQTSPRCPPRCGEIGHVPTSIPRRCCTPIWVPIGTERGRRPVNHYLYREVRK